MSRSLHIIRHPEPSYLLFYRGLEAVLQLVRVLANIWKLREMAAEQAGPEAVGKSPGLPARRPKQQKRVKTVNSFSWKPSLKEARKVTQILKEIYSTQIHTDRIALGVAEEEVCNELISGGNEPRAEH